MHNPHFEIVYLTYTTTVSTHVKVWVMLEKVWVMPVFNHSIYHLTHTFRPMKSISSERDVVLNIITGCGKIHEIYDVKGLVHDTHSSALI